MLFVVGLGSFRLCEVSFCCDCELWCVCVAMRRILVRKVFVGCGFCVFLEGVEVNFDREGQIIMVCDEDIFGFFGL